MCVCACACEGILPTLSFSWLVSPFRVCKTIAFLIGS